MVTHAQRTSPWTAFPGGLHQLSGPIAVIGCGDGLTIRALRDIQVASGADWYYFATRPGGTHGFSAEIAGIDVAPEALAETLFNEIQAVEHARGTPFAAFVDLAHIDCAARGYYGGRVRASDQLPAIRASQDGAAALFKADRPRYALIYDPRDECWC